MNKFLSLALLAALVVVCYSTPTHNKSFQADDLWIANIAHGNVAFHQNPADYQVYRNVMDFGCAGDGIQDDTACINTAISSGGRCGNNCGSSTIQPAIIYFPAGRYLISSPILMYYFSQLVGNPNDRPVLVASPTFEGMGLLDSDPYTGQGDGQWYTNQNNFFRQVRNFVIDLTLPPVTQATTGIHWQVAQATSLVNIHFLMTPGSAAQGIWMENGSGGFMSDLSFEGGKFGMWVGNQQFLSRNLVFNNCETAVYMNWNWQWTFKGLEINNCGLGIDMSAPSDTKASGVGSILLLDSTIRDTPIGVKLIGSGTPGEADTSGSLLLDNVQLVNVGAAVQSDTGVLLPGGSTTITSWGRGSRYVGSAGSGDIVTGDIPAPQKSASLLDGEGRFFSKSRPQYENSNVNDFVNVKDFGATGDGSTDDSTAIQNVINDNVNGKIVYFPHGSYVIGKTVNIPAGTRIIGELWSVLMAGGAAFQDEANPQPMLRVGEPGETGSVELVDLMFSTKGAQPGATLVEWNIKGSSQGAAGIWDSHFRVGGYQGSELQFAQCPKGQGPVPQCQCAFMLLHVTETGSGYFENVWAWTADHDLDNGLAQAQVSIYTGRGVLIESTEGPNWLYGTQSEHNVFYQYQLSNTKNVFLTMIQGETPYWQPGPKAPVPFVPNPNYDDPTYEHCADNSATCNLSWGLRAHGSSNVYLYGAGLYNFFNNYDQTCLDTEDCQDAMIDLEGNTNFYGFNVNTKAAKNIVVADNTQVIAVGLENANGFCQTINAFLP